MYHSTLLRLRHTAGSARMKVVFLYSIFIFASAKNIYHAINASQNSANTLYSFRRCRSFMSFHFMSRYRCIFKFECPFDSYKHASLQINTLTYNIWASVYLLSWVFRRDRMLCENIYYRWWDVETFEWLLKQSYWHFRIIVLAFIRRHGAPLPVITYDYIIDDERATFSNISLI